MRHIAQLQQINIDVNTKNIMDGLGAHTRLRHDSWIDTLLSYLLVPVNIVTWPFRKALANVIVPISGLGRDIFYAPEYIPFVRKTDQ